MLSQLTDYGTRAVAKMLAQYQDRPKLAALVAELGASAQEVEAALFAAIAQTAISTAEGAWLDRLGALVGEARGGVTDVEYRPFITARVLANRSKGTIEDVLAVLKAWAGGTLPAHVLKQVYPAGLELRLTAPITTAARLLRLLKATRAAGIGQMVLYQLIPDANAFTFSSSAALEASATQGFGDATNPATGGQFIGAERA